MVHKPKLKGSDDCSTTYECKDDQSQSYCSLGPPFYQLILLVFGLKYAIFLHWQQKMKIWPFLSGFRMTEVQWYKPGTVI